MNEDKACRRMLMREEEKSRQLLFLIKWVYMFLDHYSPSYMGVEIATRLSQLSVEFEEFPLAQPPVGVGKTAEEFLKIMKS